MLRTIGAKGSAAYMQCALTNWARLTGRKIGKFGYDGHSLSAQVPARTRGFAAHVEFVVDSRGPAAGNWWGSAHYPWRDRKGRKAAFRHALAEYDRRTSHKY